MDGCDYPEGLFDAELFVDKSYTTQSISFVHTTVEVEALHNASSTDYDLTGQIIWPASMLLSTHIEKCSGRYKDCRILELGAGVGVAGLVSAKLSTEPSKVVLTDHNDHVLEILQNNIDHNFKQCPNGQPKAAILHWGDDLKAFYEAHGDFDIIIGADVVFWPDAVPLLFETVGFFMKRNPHCIFVLSYISRSDFSTDLLFKSARQENLQWVAIDLDQACYTELLNNEKNCGRTCHLLKFQLKP